MDIASSQRALNYVITTLMLSCQTKALVGQYVEVPEVKVLMTASVRRQILSLYMRVFRVARSWQAQSSRPEDTERERRYIVQEARTLFRQNQQLTDQESIKKCIEECEARIEIGLHYRNPYPKPTYLPIMGLATQKGRKLRAQTRMRNQAKPVYLQSQDDT